MAAPATVDTETRDTTRRMVGITTKYSGPTDYKGSKIIARWADGHNGGQGRDAVYMDYRDDLDAGDNHYTAARLLLARSGRNEGWTITGRMETSVAGYTFVLDYVADDYTVNLKDAYIAPADLAAMKAQQTA